MPELTSKSGSERFGSTTYMAGCARRIGARASPRSGRTADRSRLEDPQGVAIELEQQSVADTAPMALQLLYDRRTGRFRR